MSSESHFVHSANSEPGVTWAADSTTGTDVGSVGKAGKHRMRRARVTKNPTSTLFGPDPTGDQVPPKTVIRCSYNKNDNRSYENIFGPPDPNARTRPLVHRHEAATPTNTKQNLFGDPPGTAVQPAGVSSSDAPHEDTFDVLFGVPEVVRNERRPYEEDTYTKLFGEPDTVRAGKDARENTQDKIFGPPIVGASPPQRPGSRSENTQEDLFGPPLPTRAGRAGRTRDRSLLYLFKPEALDEPAPPTRTTMTRLGRINAETQDKLFGGPSKVPPPPPLTEDTTRNLFAPLELDAEARIAQYEENRYNPITGEGHAEKHTAPPLPSRTTKPRLRRPPTPAPFSLGCGLDARDTKDAPVVQMILEQQRKRWAQLNTITGDPTTYSSAAARKIEC